MSAQPFDRAWHDALYGPAGFYRRTSPAQHFRTSIHASPLMAKALARLARGCGLRRVLDIGSGRGELLQALADVDPDLELVGVDVVPRPPSLPTSARWVVSPGGDALPPLDAANALVVAHEWLDDVPCPVLEVDALGRLRVVEVSPQGQQRLAGAPTAADLDWVASWWPVEGAVEGARVEVGLPRDLAWARLVQAASGSVVLAVDYSHTASARPTGGTLMGYRAGRPVAPMPDGSCDLTAHVALDAVAAATSGLVTASVLTTQRAALRALGVDARNPSHDLATSDPVAYLAALARAGEGAELLAPGGLGGFGWLLQSTGPVLPPWLDSLSPYSSG